MGLPIGEGGVERLGVLVRTGDVGITRRLGKHSTLNDVVHWNCLLVGAGGRVIGHLHWYELEMWESADKHLKFRMEPVNILTG